jgi:DNA modification methylase
VIRDIHPKSPIARLRRDYAPEELACRIDTAAAAAVVGMSFNYAVRAVGYASGSRPRTITLEQVLGLLELDGYQETFVPRSMVPDYLVRTAAVDSAERPDAPTLELPADHLVPKLLTGHAGDLLLGLPKGSVQCAVTSSPYWGMRVYDSRSRDIRWADGERCPYGFEQTPEGFIRHTVELLHMLRPSLTATGSVWWNLMDTYNTRTPIRGSSREKLSAMGGHSDYALGWTEHQACRHSAGHMFLNDGELALIPARVAERASRIGYWYKSCVIWDKDSTPEPVKSRVTRQAETILHLSVRATPYFDKAEWKNLDSRLGGSSGPYESPEKLTDVWYLPTAIGGNGHGAEFPLALPARCIALTTKPGDLVLDPFVGSGTSALAAMELQRRFVGFDISQTYVDLATKRIQSRARQLSSVKEAKRLSSPSRNGQQRSRTPRAERLFEDANQPPAIGGSRRQPRV